MDKEDVFSIVASLFLMLITASLPFGIVAEAQSQGFAIGVRVGDWVKYGDVLVNWNSTDPNAKPDPEIVKLNNTEWFRNVVTNVDYPRITFEHIRQLKNDTQESNVLQVDVESGSGNGTLFFTLAGLFLGDLLYSESMDPTPVLINETALRKSAGITRLVNHLNLTKTVEGDPSQSFYVSINHYWDRETGFLTERQGAFSNLTGSFQTRWTRSDKIVDTNLWSGEETERPIAVAGDNQTVYQDSPVVFNANASSDNTGIVSYHWVFGDGTTGDGIKVTHTYSSGTFYAILIVKDASGNMAFDAIIVQVDPPIQNGTVDPPPQNGFGFEVIGAVVIVVAVLVGAWMLRSRKKRRIRVRPRHRVSQGFY